MKVIFGRASRRRSCDIVEAALGWRELPVPQQDCSNRVTSQLEERRHTSLSEEQRIADANATKAALDGKARNC